MKKARQTRLAILRSELGITQIELAKWTGLSLVYVKKLEYGKRPVSKRVAGAISAATGADTFWLMGNGATYPIRGAYDEWKKENAFQIHKRHQSEETTNKDIVVCMAEFLNTSNKLAAIIAKGFSDKKPSLALARIRASMNELASEFNVKPQVSVAGFVAYQPKRAGQPVELRGKDPKQTAAEIAQRLGETLNSEAGKRYFRR